MTEPNQDEDLDLKAIGDEIDAEGSDPAAETEEAQQQEESVDPAADEQTQESSEAAKKALPSTEIEIAGRKYKDLDALKRSHDHLYRHASRLEQELAQERKWGKQYRDLEDVWKKNPDLFKKLQTAEEEYYSALKGGATVAQAKKVSGTTNVSPEVMRELKELREQLTEQREYVNSQKMAEVERALNAEYAEFRAAHKDVDDAVADSVRSIMLEYAEKRNEELSFEQGYETYLVRQNRMNKTELERVRAQANTSSPTGSAPKAAKKPGQWSNDAEFDAELSESLKGLPD